LGLALFDIATFSPYRHYLRHVGYAGHACWPRQIALRYDSHILISDARLPATAPRRAPLPMADDSAGNKKKAAGAMLRVVRR